MGFEISRVLTSTLDDSNFVGVQMETFSDGAPFVELYTNGNFRSVPQDPNDEGAPSAIVFEDGTDYFAQLGTDPRVISKLPPGTKGSSTQFYVHPNAEKCDFGHMDENGWTLIVHDGAQDHVISVNRTTHVISIVQKDGSAIELKDGEINLRTSAGSISLATNKLQVFGDFACTGSISQVGGRPVVFADALLVLLQSLAGIIDGKLPNPAVPAGAAVASALIAPALSPGVGSTLNTLVQLKYAGISCAGAVGRVNPSCLNRT